MRSALYQKTDFLARMKRKPAQDLLYQKAISQTLTAEDIENSGQPLWFRTALYEMMERDGQTHRQVIDQIVAQTEAAQLAASLQTYPIYQWTSNMYEIVPEKGMSIEVETGDYILIDRRINHVKIEYSLLQVNPAIIDFIEQNASFVCDQTDPMFIEMVAQKRVLKRN